MGTRKQGSNRRLCAVKNCNRNRENSPSLVFAGLPKQQLRYDQWMKNLQLDEAQVTKLTHVCSLHFTSSQFTCPKKICLKKTAVPTILHGTEIQQQSVICTQPDQFRQETVQTLTTNNETVYQVQVSEIFTPQIPTFKRIAPKITDNVEISQPIINSTLATGNQPSIPKNRKTERLFFKDSSESTSGNSRKNQRLQSITRSSIENCYTCKLKSRQIKRLHDQLRYCRRKMSGMKKHDSRSCVQDLVEKTSRLTSHAKVFLQSQFHRSVDSLKNKRKNYSETEKTMAIYLWKQLGTKGYEGLKKMGFLIPTIRTLTSINNVTSDINNLVNSHELNPGDEIVIENPCASNNVTYQIQSVQVHGKDIITIDGDSTNTTVHLESIVISSPPL